MASSITLSDDLEVASLSVDAGDSFYANGYDVTVGDVTLDTPLDFGLGNGSTWTISGDWLEINGACSGTWGYSGSTVIFTGTANSITKIASSQYFYHLTIASGAVIEALATTTLNAYGNLHVYGTYYVTGAKTIGTYYGGKVYLHNNSTLDVDTGTFALYDYSGGGGIAHYNTSATFSGSSFAVSYTDATSVLVPGDYSNFDRVVFSGGNLAACVVTLQTGTYQFDDIRFTPDGINYAILLDLSGTSGVKVYVNGNLEITGASAPTAFDIDNSGGDAWWYLGGNVTLTNATTGDITWTAGNGYIVLNQGVNVALDFAGATTEPILCNKTAGTVDFIDGTHEIAGDYPDSVTVSGARIDGVDAETIWLRGDFTISSGDWYLGAGTTWKFYGDVDWSGVTTMDYETSTMQCWESGSWTWKNNSTTICPYNLYVRLNRTLTCGNAGGTYSYIRGRVDVHGTLTQDVTSSYISPSFASDVRVHEYGTIDTDVGYFFMDTPTVGITKMAGTMTGSGTPRILLYAAAASSIIAEGDYDLGVYLYGLSSHWNMEPDGTYSFASNSYLVPSASPGWIKINLPKYLTVEYLQFDLTNDGIIYWDASNAERTYVALQVITSADPSVAGTTIDWTYDPDQYALEIQSSSTLPIAFPTAASTVAPPIIVDTDAGFYMSVGFTTLECQQLMVVGGGLDPNSNDVTTSGDFTIGEDATLLDTNLGGVTLTAGGKFSMAGSPSVKMDVKPGSTWYIDASEACLAWNVDMQNCTASGQPGVAFDSIDSGSNTNWTFTTGENVLYQPTYGINFLMRTLEDVSIDASGYALGFYGAGENETVEVGSYQTKTYLVDKNGTLGEVQCRNVTYIDDETGYVDHRQTPVNIRYIPNYQATMNIRLLVPGGEDAFVALAEAKFYNGYNYDIPPDGITIKVAELRHVGYRLNDSVGWGSKEWFDAADGEWFRLVQSPGERGVKSNSVGVWVGPQHDWYLAISVSPHEVGSRVFGLQFRAEYI